MVAFFCPPRWGGAGGRPFGHEFCASEIVPAGAASISTTLDIGEPDPRRLVVVAIGAAAASSVTAVTIGGVAAAIEQQTGTNTLIAVAYAFVPQGVDASIDVTFNTTANRDALIATWAIYGLEDPEPTIIGTRNGAGSSNRTTTFAVPDVPAILIAAAMGDETNNTASSWTGDLTQNWYEQGTQNPANQAGGASGLIEIAGSVSATTRCRAIIGLGWTEP